MCPICYRQSEVLTFRDFGRSITRLDQDITAFRSESCGYSFRKCINTLEQGSSSFNAEFKILYSLIRTKAEHIKLGALSSSIIMPLEARHRDIVLLTLCANLCCCRFVAVTAAGLILDNEPEYVDAERRMEARVLDASARCMLE